MRSGPGEILIKHTRTGWWVIDDGLGIWYGPYRYRWVASLVKWTVDN